MTPQPHEFEGPYHEPDINKEDGSVVYVMAYFIPQEGEDISAVKANALEWIKQQKQIADEINSWVDEELKDYSND